MQEIRCLIMITALTVIMIIIIKCPIQAHSKVVCHVIKKEFDISNIRQGLIQGKRAGVQQGGFGELRGGGGGVQAARAPSIWVKFRFRFRSVNIKLICNAPFTVSIEGQ